MSELKICRESFGDGIGFSSVTDSKFRHNGITINLITPLAEESVCANAILPLILRKSSGNYPDFTALERELCNLYGASLDANVIKYAGRQILTFSITFLDDKYTLDSEIISDKCANLLCDMVLNPNFVDGAFVAEDFEIEKQNLVDAIEAEINEKRSYALSRCNKLMFEGTPNAISKYGTVEGVKALTPSIAAAQYKTLLETCRVEISFIGCGDPTAAKETLRNVFLAEKRSYTEEKSTIPLSSGTAIKEETEYMDINQGKLVLGFRTPEIKTAKESYILSVMSALYGGTPSSKLFVNVREKLSLCYYCAARSDRSNYSMVVDIGVEHQNKEQAQVAILAQLEDIKNGVISEDELNHTKLAIINSLRGVGDSISAIDAWFVMRLLVEDESTVEETIAGIKAVTKEEVQQMASGIRHDTVYFLTAKEGEDE